LSICEQLGQEPDPDKMPLETSELPEELQVAFFVHNLLSDRWDGASGTYLGKQYSEFDLVCNLLNIDSPRDTFLWVKRYDTHLVNYRLEKQERRRKEEEKKAKQKSNSAGGNPFVHNVSNHERY